MSIMRRIRVFQRVVVLALAAIAGSAILTLRGASYDIERVQLSRRQADARAGDPRQPLLGKHRSVAAHRRGGEKGEEFEDAGGKLITRPDHLRRLSKDDDDLFSDRNDDAEENEEAARIERMRGLVREIDRAVERVLLLDTRNARALAIALFRRDIETLISEAVQNQRDAIAAASTIARAIFSAWRAQNAKLACLASRTKRGRRHDHPTWSRTTGGGCVRRRGVGASKGAPALRRVIGLAAAAGPAAARRGRTARTVAATTTAPAATAARTIIASTAPAAGAVDIPEFLDGQIAHLVLSPMLLLQAYGGARGG